MPADTATAAAPSQTLPPFRKLPFKEPDIEVRHGADGSIYLSSRTPVGPSPRSIPHQLDERAALHPERAWLKQRLPGHGPWRTITYGVGADMTRRIAQGLLDRGLGPDAPLLILSGNSIEHALMSLGAQRIGAPATPISMAYSTMSTDFAKLKHCFEAVKPKAIGSITGSMRYGTSHVSSASMLGPSVSIDAPKSGITTTRTSRRQ